jgi:seryl-tRNA synthetase
MAEVQSATADQTAYLADLVDAGLLVESGVPGVYGWSASFERVRLAVESTVARAAAADGCERLRFPPVLPRRHLEDAGYLKSFPHLVGSIFAFHGDEDDAVEQEARASRHEDWDEFQRMTDLVLVPAACYPVYPAIARRGPVPQGGVRIDAGGAYVFRREPSGDPSRLQVFHQCELVCIGEPATVVAWRDSWCERALEILDALGFDAEIDVASDSFFGRGGRMLAASQLEQALKLEATVHIAGPEPTALASFNYHERHFASAFELRMVDGSAAHTACVGFGEERIVLALFRAHGPGAKGWPASVRARLWPPNVSGEAS